MLIPSNVTQCSLACSQTKRCVNIYFDPSHAEAWSTKVLLALDKLLINEQPHLSTWRNISILHRTRGFHITPQKTDRAKQGNWGTNAQSDFCRVTFIHGHPFSFDSEVGVPCVNNRSSRSCHEKYNSSLPSNCQTSHFTALLSSDSEQEHFVQILPYHKYHRWPSFPFLRSCWPSPWEN
jgi:hypothetical protein